MNSARLRKLSIFTALLLLFLAIECAKESPTDGQPEIPEPETITAPTAPSGVGIIEPGITTLFTTGDATSNLGHEIEYRFIWGDRDHSEWLPSSESNHAWSSEGTFYIRSLARCRLHTEIESDSSQPSTILVATEAVTSPETLSGPDFSCPGQSAVYTAGGAICNFDHPVEYQFDWGDGSQSAWSITGSASHIWSLAGVYSIIARSRCTVDTLLISDWTQGLSNTTMPAAWTIDRSLPGLTGDFNLSNRWKVIYVPYDGPPARLIALTPYVYGYGGGILERCGDFEIEQCFNFEMTFGINELPWFSIDGGDLYCWLGYPHTQFDCGGTRITEDRWLGPQFLTPGDSLRVLLTTVVCEPTPGCLIIAGNYGARVDSVRLIIELECDID